AEIAGSNPAGATSLRRGEGWGSTAGRSATHVRHRYANCVDALGTDEDARARDHPPTWAGGPRTERAGEDRLARRPRRLGWETRGIGGDFPAEANTFTADGW